MQQWRQTEVLVRKNDAEVPAPRVEGEYRVLWRCVCGRLFGASSIGETCLGCGAEIVEVRDEMVR